MGLLGKLFRRKDTDSGSPPPRVQDAVPQPIAKRWDEDESLRYVLGSAVDAPAVRQVFDLCDRLEGLTPSAPWCEEMIALLAGNTEGIRALRAVALRETPFADPRSYDHVPFVIGVVHAISLTEPADAVPLLLRVVELYGEPGRGGYYMYVASAAVLAIGSITSERTLPALQRIRAEAKLGEIRRVASGEIDAALRRARLSYADVPEYQAETYELDQDGLRVIELGHGYTLTIRLNDDGTVSTFFSSPTGQRVEGKPLDARAADSVREAAEIVSKLRLVVASQRFRLKELMRDQRTLTYEVWMEYYLGNLVTGRLSPHLLWESSIDGGEHWQRFLPVWSARHGVWLRLDVDGVAHDISAQSQIRLVDPRRVPAAEKQAWAVRLGKLKVTQPFEQVAPR